MTKLPAARPSPRVAGGVLRWYAGDTFKVTLRLELQDQDGEAVTVGADDSVTVRFSDEQNAPVHTFSFTGVTGNCVTLVFDDGEREIPAGGVSLRYPLYARRQNDARAGQLRGGRMR